MRENRHVGNGASEAEFVRLRTERDRTLPPPALMHPAIEANLYGGRLPARVPAESGDDLLR